MNAPPADIDVYLAAVPADARAALEKLRRTIRSAAPKAVEVISYRIPTFRYHGGLVAFAAFKNHCSFFPMSYATIAAHRDELAPWYAAKGTIRFTVDRPLPAALVRKMVKARIAENEARARARSAKAAGQRSPGAGRTAASASATLRRKSRRAITTEAG